MIYRRKYSFTTMIAFLTAMLFIVPMMFASCANLAGVNDSPQLKEKKTYMTARKEFALTLEKYNVYYNKADLETQAEWKKDIDPWFNKVNKALAAWKLAINNDWDPASQSEKYLDLKSELLILLVDVFGDGG